MNAGEENDPDSIRTMLAFGLSNQPSWDDLLEKHRVVVLAEPGTGKTVEFRAATQRLRDAGKPAFFCRIELLQDIDLRQAFDPGLGTSTEFDEWLAGEQEGYFFLDSVDEARLHSHSAFEIALRRFVRALEERSNLNRVKVFVSCRVSNWQATADRDMFLVHLSGPPVTRTQGNEERDKEEFIPATEGVAQDVSSTTSDEKDAEGTEDNVFQLAPLDEPQIQQFSIGKGVDNPAKFIEAIARADAQIFAERPQDLLDLIEYWKSRGRLGRHEEMLVFNVQKKLDEPDSVRGITKPLSAEKADRGAECLAAAATL